jgi:hypothetical protein
MKWSRVEWSGAVHHVTRGVRVHSVHSLHFYRRHDMLRLLFIRVIPTVVIPTKGRVASVHLKKRDEILCSFDSHASSYLHLEYDSSIWDACFHSLPLVDFDQPLGTRETPWSILLCLCQCLHKRISSGNDDLRRFNLFQESINKYSDNFRGK